MRKLTIAAFVSVDGVMQAPGGPNEDTEGGFAFGGWNVPHFDDTLGAAVSELFSDPFDLLLGRRTYEIFAGYWPQREGRSPIADQFGAINKYVATRQADYATRWRNTHVLKGDAVAAVRRLKQEEGRNLMTQGSANFIQSLLASDLVDQLQVMTFPVILGKGKRMFEGASTPAGLKLLSAVTSASGVTVSRYAYDGAVRTGSFEDD